LIQTSLYCGTTLAPAARFDFRRPTPAVCIRPRAGVGCLRGVIPLLGPDADENFLGVTLDVSKECREKFLETNKKTNYITRQETARQIY
jgi:hypothetical protein